MGGVDRMDRAGRKRGQMIHAEAVLRALPGESVMIAARTGLSLRVVQGVLGEMRASGAVARSTRWVSQFGYTWWYSKEA